MKKLLLLFSVALITVNTWGQNEFPDNSNIKIDGYSITFIRPETTGGWARGLSFYDVDESTRYSSLGLYGSAGTPVRWYIAHGDSPWSSGNGLYVVTNGNVGIGTTTPSEKLEINGDIQINGSGSTIGLSNVSNGWLKVGNTLGLDNNEIMFASTSAHIGTVNNYDLFFVTNGTKRMTITSGGNVGIGTTNPYTRFQVGQNNSSKTSDELMRLSMDVTESGVKSALHIDANPSSSFWDRGVAIELGHKSSTYNEYTSRIVHYGNSGSTRASKLQIQTHSKTDGVWNTGIFMDDKGNVGIGTTDPDYLLSVKGTIGCGEVIVEDVSQWADFVFEPDYNLMSLVELDNFIQENRHLPEIPTTKEVEENGISVGEMNAKLLQKVEELTLYVIELQKQNDKQSKEIEILKKSMNK